MKILLPLFLCLAACTTFAAETYTDADAAKHIGETAEIQGKVSDIHVADSGLVLLNFGEKFPKQSFTAVIPPGRAALFPKPEQYKDATIAVTGPIRLHKERPEMTIESPEQLKVITPSQNESPAPEASASPAAAILGNVTSPDGVTRKIVPFSRNPAVNDQ